MNNLAKAPKIRFKGFSDEWEQIKLRDAATEIIAGGDINKDLLFPRGLFPVIANALNNEGIIGFYEKNFRVKAPAVTVTGRGDVGHATAREINFTPVVRLLSVKTIHDIYFLENAINLLHIVTESTGVPQLTVPQLSQYLLKFPQSFKEEERIGTFFRKFDRIVTFHQRKLEKLQNIKKALLEKMFPRNGSKYPEIRFKGFSDEWELRKLGDMMDVTSVKRIHQSDWTDRGVRFLRARDIVCAAKNQEPDKYLYISKEKYEEYSALSGKVNIFDLLVTGVGTIGVPYLVKSLEPVYFKDGNIIWFRNLTQIDGNFLFYSFLGNQIQSFIKESSGIGTVGTYTIESGKKTPISLPDRKEQQQIGNLFCCIDNFISLQQRKLEKLQNLKKALLEKMFV